MSLNFDLKKEYFNSFLTDEYKNHEAIGDYNDEIEYFSYKSDTNLKIFINQLIITVEDNAKFKYQNYGSDIKLLKGLKIYFTNQGVKKYIVGEFLPIKKNRDWLQYSCKTEQISFNNAHSFFKIRFNFFKDNNTPIILKKTMRLLLN